MKVEEIAQREGKTPNTEEHTTKQEGGREGCREGRRGQEQSMPHMLRVCGLAVSSGVLEHPKMNTSAQEHNRNTCTMV